MSEKLTDEIKHYYTIVFEDLIATFILSQYKLPSIFAGQPTRRTKGRPKWQFRIWKDKDSQYKLKLSGNEMTTDNIKGSLNNWNQIYDFSEKLKLKIFIIRYTDEN
jgi:hypothetical protein